MNIIKGEDVWDEVRELRAEVERLRDAIREAHHLMSLREFDRARSNLANSVNLYGEHSVRCTR